MRRRLHTLITIMAFPILAYAQIPCNGEFILSGDASNDGDCIQLTADALNQSGCAWLNTPVDFSMPFTHNMTANFGNDDGGADGICLVYQTGGVNICGGLGIGIGAQGIPNSFIVEFDTWDNGPGQSDIPPDHCAVAINGNLNNQLEGPVDLGNIEDGNDHTITFSWDPGSNTYVVTFDGMVVISAVYDIVNNVFGGNNLAYWGYTSATGGAANEHLVCPILPPPLVVEAGPAVTIPCPEGLVTLNATGTAQGPTYVYSWSSPDGGQIVSGFNTLTPTVQGPGTYILTLTDVNGNCQESDQVVVTVEPIEAVIQPVIFAPCEGQTLTLDGTASSSGPNISYQWTSPDGQIVTDPTQPTVEVALEGTYILTVIYSDGPTFCTAETEVQLVPDPNVPDANAVGATVTCAAPVVELSGAGSSVGGNYSYQWVTMDGVIVSGGQSLTPEVGAPGTYTLIVTNNDNGCFSEATAIVDQNTDQPDAVGGVDGQLDCNSSSVTLDGTGSSTGPDIVYSWSTDDGNIVSGAGSLQAVADAPGTYLLLVEDRSNGCFQTAVVAVDAGPEPPAFSLNTPDTLNCVDTLVALSATFSSPDANVAYTWSALSGLIDGADTLSSALAAAPGAYLLEVTDSLSGCSSTDTVQVAADTLLPLADAGENLILSCGAPSVSLDGSGSSLGGDFVYSWQTETGSLISDTTGLSPAVGSAGWYLLTVQDSTNGCLAIDSVLVASDINAPQISLLPPDTLNCGQQSVLLDASASGQSPNYVLSWSSPNGQFLSGTDGLMPVVGAPGQYTLLVTDTTNDCSSSETVTVLQDTVHPQIEILPVDTLNCSLTSQTLDATGSDSGAAFAYLWSSQDGQILSGADSPQPLIDAPGTYQLEILNLDNQCQTVASVEVAQDTLSPSLLIAPPATLSCAQSSLQLNAAGSSSGPGFTIAWSTPDGSIMNGADSLQPTVDAAGTYTLTITNEQNFCTRAESVQLAIDTLRPLISAGPDTLINCRRPELQLAASAIDPDGRFAFSWSSPDGNLVTGAQLLQPVVNEAGTYELSALDTVNGCTAIDEVVVSADFTAPDVAIAAPEMLTCVDTVITLNGSASSSGANFLYQWSSASAGLQGPDDSPQAAATQAGWYALEVENTGNGCTAVDSVLLEQDVNIPVASIALPSPITCAQPTVQLDASASSQGAGLALQWSTTTGSILSGADGLQPVVDAGGEYQLAITDEMNDCRTVAQVTVEVDTLVPLAEAGANRVLNCRDTTVMLDGSASASDPLITYSWTSADGNILQGANGATPVVDAAGTYTLEVENTENGCAQSDTLLVSADFEAPEALISPPAVLNCSQTEVLLDASASSGSAPLTFRWNGPDASSLPGSEQLTVDQPGAYRLQVENTLNFCIDTAMVTVLQDTVAPMLQIAAADTLNCGQQSILLSANAEEAGSSPVLNWSTTDGLLLGNAGSLSPEVGAPGTYSLQLFNPQNGCSSQASVTVAQDTVHPQVSIFPAGVLTCSVTSVELVSSVTNAGPAAVFEWASSTGNLLSGSDTPTALADAPGIYQLQVTNPENGCANTAAVEVTQDVQAPTAAVALPDTLTCTATEVQLDASASNGDALSFQWSALAGNLSSGITQPLASTDTPGTYQVIVENAFNACRDTAQAEVAQNTIAPVAELAPADTLDCGQDEVTLNGSASAGNAELQFSWNSTDGQFSGSTGLAVATATDAGTYQLTVVDRVNGCRDSAEVLVFQDTLAPLITLSEPLALTCERQAVVLNATGSDFGDGFSLQWSGSVDGFLDLQDMLNPTVGLPGVYTLRITNLQNECWQTASIAVARDTVPPVADAGEDFIIPCFDTDRQLDGSGSSQGSGFQYNWVAADGQIAGNPNALSPAIEGPGQYQLTVLDMQNGCTSTDVVRVSQDLPQAVAVLRQPACFGDRGQIEMQPQGGGQGPFVYSVDGGQNFRDSPLFELPAGAYEWVIQDIAGCEDRGEVELLQPDSVAVILPVDSYELAFGDSLLLPVQTNVPAGELSLIQWQPADALSCGDCLRPFARPLQTTDFLLQVQTAEGCEDRLKVRIFVDREMPVYFPNAFSPNGDGKNDAFFPFAKAGAVREVRAFRIFSRWGETVFENKNFAPNDPREGWPGLFRGEPLNTSVFAYVAEIELIDGRVERFAGDVLLMR